MPMEVCLMSAVSGLPGIVRLIDCFERHDSFIIVMERPEPCKDLFDYITEKGILEEQVRHFECCDKPLLRIKHCNFWNVVIFPS